MGLTQVGIRLRIAAFLYSRSPADPWCYCRQIPRSVPPAPLCLFKVWTPWESSHISSWTQSTTACNASTRKRATYSFPALCLHWTGHGNCLLCLRGLLFHQMQTWALKVKYTPDVWVNYYIGKWKLPMFVWLLGDNVNILWHFKIKFWACYLRRCFNKLYCITVK